MLSFLALNNFDYDTKNMIFQKYLKTFIIKKIEAVISHSKKLRPWNENFEFSKKSQKTFINKKKQFWDFISHSKKLWLWNEKFDFSKESQKKIN